MQSYSRLFRLLRNNRHLAYKNLHRSPLPHLSPPVLPKVPLKFLFLVDDPESFGGQSPY